MRIMVHPSAMSGPVPPNFASYSGLESWAEAQSPLITFVGFGIGSTPAVGGAASRGRDVGIATWVATTGDYSGHFGWSNCSTPSETPTLLPPAVVVSPTDIAASLQPSGTATTPGWCFVPDGTDYAGSSQSHAGCGDSGGPVLAGTGPAFKGLTPTALPANTTGESYNDQLNYQVGVGSSYTSDANGSPRTVYTPTYTAGASAWLLSMLADDDGDTVVNAWDQWPDCDDNGPDTDADGVPDDCDPCPCDAANADQDGDGVCDAVCPGEKSDNCPQVPNPGQQNCNADAEAAASKPAVGDACDPVPCPRAKVASSTMTSTLYNAISTMEFDVEPIRSSPDGTEPQLFRGVWRHRFCDCPDADGSEAAAGKCSFDGDCPIGPNVPFNNNPDWVPTYHGPPGSYSYDVGYMSDFRRPAELQPGGQPASLRRMNSIGDEERAGHPVWMTGPRSLLPFPGNSGASATSLCPSPFPNHQVELVAEVASVLLVHVLHLVDVHSFRDRRLLTTHQDYRVEGQLLEEQGAVAGKAR